jgi:aldehyde:ferredoxin oxidoreductase
MALRSLNVDLSARKLQVQQLPAEVERDYLGGRGLIAWQLLYRLPPETPPMAPENMLIFAAGRLAGTASFATGGFVVGTRSPLTGAIGYSWAQGHWGAALRQAGYDMINIVGQAADWSYLVLDAGRVELRPAERLIGLDTRATVTAIQAELGREFVVACLGPAGEAEVSYASIIAEARYMAEPAGPGAVMANKRIKAIAIRAGQTLPVADQRRLSVALEVIRRRVAGSRLAANIKREGSLHFFERALETGALTSNNGRNGAIDEAFHNTHKKLAGRARREDRGCNNCPLPCYFDYARRSGTGALLTAPMPQPELELVAGFGARCGIHNSDTLVALADLCLRLGIDPVSASAAIAFMMESQEEGLHRSDNLPWGDADAVISAIDRMAQRQEKRDVLTLGVGEMRSIFWGGDAFAPQVKGLAMAALDPRAMNGIALATITSAIGGDFRYAMNYEELVAEPPSWIPETPAAPQETSGKIQRLIWHERFAAVLDAVGMCRRLGLMAYQVSPGEVLAMISAVTGQAMAPADMVKIGERIVTVERLFARREGDDGSLDALPERWSSTALNEGAAAGRLPALAELLPEYYRRHGWNSSGDPTPQWLKSLGISDPASQE